jgi:Kef-type K+ transport system membrane component KefB
MPHDNKAVRKLGANLEKTVAVLLLPAFFAFTGMRTQLGLVNGAAQWGWCVIIILVATLGKFGGTLAAARFTGMAWRDSAALGMLMNTRGLMELVVLNIGLDLGVISPTLFAMLILMALVTTIATTPILRMMGFYTESGTEPKQRSGAAARTVSARIEVLGAGALQISS